MSAEIYKDKAFVALLQKALADIAATMQATMPPRENPRVNTSIDSVYASGPLGRAHCVIHGNCNYKQTGLMQAYGAYSLLQQPPKRVGFASGCQAFGHRELLGVLRAGGPFLQVGARAEDGAGMGEYHRSDVALSCSIKRTVEVDQQLA